jgi:hypothetical protein
MPTVRDYACLLDLTGSKLHAVKMTGMTQTGPLARQPFRREIRLIGK